MVKSKIINKITVKQHCQESKFAVTVGMAKMRNNPDYLSGFTERSS